MLGRKSGVRLPGLLRSSATSQVWLSGPLKRPPMNSVALLIASASTDAVLPPMLVALYWKSVSAPLAVSTAAKFLRGWPATLAKEPPR